MPRLLVVKLGAIGDVIMAIPAVYAMHAAGYQVDWICGTAVAPILRLYDWIDVIEVDERSLLLGSRTDRLRALVRLWRTLHQRSSGTLNSGLSYDLCATLYYDARYRLLTWPIRSRRRITLSHTDRNSRLIPGRHHSSEYARLLLAAVPEHPNPEQRSPKHSSDDGEQPHQLAPVAIPASRLTPVLPPSQSGHARVVLVPAGSRNLLREDTLRRWPIESYVALAQALLARGCEVVLAGGPGDEWAAAHFNHLAITDCIGKFSLVQSLALMNSADLVLSHDTGPLHLAALTRAAVLAIFGPTDPRVFLPQRSNCIALWGGEGFACRPCYDGRDFAPCTHNGCMHQVTPELVLAQAELLLAAVREGRELAPRILVPEHTPLLVPGRPPLLHPASIPGAPSAESSGRFSS